VENYTLLEIIELRRKGIKVKTKTLAESITKVHITQPSQLFANSPVLQKFAEKHWKTIIEPMLKK
jgi:hypothetical protein